MQDKFVISDTHFGHANILTFNEDDGKPAREFDSVEEMNERMVQNWNSVVKPDDKVYHLGDVCFPKKSLSILDRLNGSKRLVIGNHDDRHLKFYMDNHFKKGVYIWRIFEDEGFILSHIPLRRQDFRRGCVLNVHGHVHRNPPISDNHFNACVEMNNYTPVSFDVLIDAVHNLRMKEMG